MKRIKVTAILFSFILLFSACSQEPVEMHYGSDECAHCKMMITDSQFASQLVTSKGKAFKFDAIECLAVYHRTHSEEFEGAKLWVSNYQKPGEWLNAREAQYVKSDVINSPMGESLLAFPSKKAAEEHIQERPGELLIWSEVAITKM